uniref:Uncharacterized protein n=1 Tax=Arundo donax TaxID=35708 RepID=A0A0A9A2G5_ARUDO
MVRGGRALASTAALRAGRREEGSARGLPARGGAPGAVSLAGGGRS